MSAEKIRVMVRYAGKGKATRRDWSMSDLLAVFPTEPADRDGHDMMCYAPVGEHGGCSSAYVRESTKPATKAQTEAMLKLLRSHAGYRGAEFVVVKKMTQAHYAERRRQARRV